MDVHRESPLKPLPLVLLDGDSEVTDVIRAKPLEQGDQPTRVCLRLSRAGNCSVMTEFEWEQTAKRGEVAKLLRSIADGLAKGGEVTLERDSWELKLNVPEELQVELELEVEGGETELEIELKWSSAPAKQASQAEKPAAKRGRSGARRGGRKPAKKAG